MGLPRCTSVAEVEALSCGPQLDKAVWYALRRLRYLKPLQRWPLPLPWSTDATTCLDLIDFLLGKNRPSVEWAMSFTNYDTQYAMVHGIKRSWECMLSGGRGEDGWEVMGAGKTLPEAFCRALVYEAPYEKSLSRGGMRNACVRCLDQNR